MAGTRSQTSSESNTAAREAEGALAARFEALEKAIASQIEQNQRRDAEMSVMLEAFKTMSNQNQANASMMGEAVRDEAHGVGTIRAGSYRYNQHDQAPHRRTRLTKIDFPRFDGTKLVEWLGKAEEFFAIDNTPEESKVGTAAMHFDGDAAAWHQAVRQEDEHAVVLRNWRVYRNRLKERFEEVMDDPMAELKELKETDGIVAYHAKFELIRSRLTMSEEYLLSAYLAGLQLDTQMHVRMFSPQSTRQCLVLGRLYEKAHPRKEVKSNWAAQRNQTNQNNQRGLITQKKEDESKNKDLNGRLKPFLSQAEMSERRAKGLCYYCDEKYTKDHYLKHKKVQLYSLDCGEGEFHDAVDSWERHCEEEEEDNLVEMEDRNDKAHISLNAVTGVSDYTTMRVRGVQGKKTIYVLIDSGSTHNFIDRKLAKMLGCKLESTHRTQVAVADGSRIAVDGRVDGFKWQFQGVEFQADFMVIPLGCHDVVLGVQWLSTLGPITWDFLKLEMMFKWKKNKVLLHGIKPGSIQEVKSKRIAQGTNEELQLHMIYVHYKDDEQEMQLNAIEDKPPETQQYKEIEELITEFSDIFEEPTSLPPFRENHNHKITLMEGSNPVNQKPYRYAVYQKNEIDKMVKALLEAGTVQPSSSPYASPVVLVKKKDNTWRLCVDYRKLNTMTIKDRFPIPLIEDLMDELGGSSIYSKIDLRAGYHQVRMHLDDIQKTAFRTHSGHYEYVVMPFGLTNAPATFQGLMNAVFREHLRKFVLIFFDDILIYSRSREEHISHLRVVFKIMRANKLYAKKSKCEFATRKVEYLGHFISAEGVSTDPAKIKAITEWPKPKNLKALRGFLGLAGYYRRFVQSFGAISRPLSALTKKDSFLWNEEAQTAFESLKESMVTTPTLALPRFDKVFVVETDASGQGIGAVLMQEGHPVAYISRQLKGKQLHLSIYEKELLAVVFAVQKWRHYLLTNHFIIKTDQRSLKYLLEQRLNTPIQQQWLPKLLEFDYEIQYRQGKENVAADALSRVEGSEVLHMAMTVLDCDLLQRIKDAYQQDPVAKKIIEELEKSKKVKKHYVWSMGILRRKQRIVVPADGEIRKMILEWLHSSSQGGHSGREVTIQRIKGVFYWKGLAKDVQAFLRNCSVCQQCKYDTSASPGLLQPLPIPEAVWTDISMDFIDGLPMSSGKEVILVIVDRFSKAAHFIGLSHPYTASSVAQAFLDTFYKLHGFPRSIVSDRDAVFVSDFWRELFQLQGCSLNLSTAYHPQSDGQTEVVNRCLETYLRCMTGERPKQWSSWLPLAEYWYNTSYHSSTQTTPFEIVYGQPPPIHLPYVPGESKVQVVAKCLEDREKMLLLLKFHLLRAQHRMKQQADKHRSERSFNIGDKVYLKLQPYRQNSVVTRSSPKLAPKFYGPYEVLDKVGVVAYKLKLPSSSKVHPVFHVSQLKKAIGDVHTTHHFPTMVHDVFEKEPEYYLERKMVKRQGRAATMVLVKWRNQAEEEATWEFLFEMQRRFPAFESCGQDVSNEGDLIRD